MSAVEDAIKVTENIVGTITAEQYKRLRKDPRCTTHVVKPQPTGSSRGDA